MPADRPNVPLTPAQIAEVDRIAATHRWSRSRALAVLVEEAIDTRERGANVAVCTTCCTDTSLCDEDRCCLACGTDLIVVADKHSAELLIEFAKEKQEVPHV